MLGILVHEIFPTPGLTHISFSYLSIAFFVIGILLIFWSIYFFKTNKTSVMPFETPKRFIREGPFKYTRNPIYLGMLLLLAGIYLFLGNPLNAVLIALFVHVMNRVIILKEEKVLEREFGREYLEYKGSVGRWIF